MLEFLFAILLGRCCSWLSVLRSSSMYSKEQQAAIVAGGMSVYDDAEDD